MLSAFAGAVVVHHLAVSSNDRSDDRRFASRVSAKTSMIGLLAVSMAIGPAIALDRLMLGALLLGLVGVVGTFHERFQPRTGHTPATAFLDSICGRWSELCILIGYAWLLHSSPWLFAVMTVIGGGFMVSYTCARAGGLGVTLTAGVVRRSERAILIAAGTLVAACDERDSVPILGCTLLACGVGATIAAVNRWRTAHRTLAQRGRKPLHHMSVDPHGYQARVPGTG